MINTGRTKCPSLFKLSFPLSGALKDCRCDRVQVCNWPSGQVASTWSTGSEVASLSQTLWSVLEYIRWVVNSARALVALVPWFCGSVLRRTLPTEGKQWYTRCHCTCSTLWPLLPSFLPSVSFELAAAQSDSTLALTRARPLLASAYGQFTPHVTYWGSYKWPASNLLGHLN